MFNDNEYEPARPVSMPVEVDDVSPSLPPPCFRKAEFLKKQYQSIRAVFTRHYQNWSTSVQNDPENVLQFTTPADTHGSTAMAKKELYLFHILRCGTPDEDKNLVEVILRTMPKECQLEEGLGECVDTDGAASDEYTPPSRGLPKRRKFRVSNDFSQSVALSFQESSRAVAEAIRESSQNLSGRTMEPGFVTEKMQKIQETQAQLSIVKSLADIDKTLKESEIGRAHV